MSFSLTLMIQNWLCMSGRWNLALKADSQRGIGVIRNNERLPYRLGGLPYAAKTQRRIKVAACLNRCPELCDAHDPCVGSLMVRAGALILLR